MTNAPLASTDDRDEDGIPLFVGRSAWPPTVAAAVPRTGTVEVIWGRPDAP
jgi:hypothetical protein